MTPHTRGLVYGFAASVLWGTVFAAARYLVEVCGLDPLFTAAMRFCGGGLLLLCWVAMTGGAGQLLRSTQVTGRIILLGLVGTTAMGALVFISAGYTTSINSSLIVNSNAIFIAMFAVLIGERVKPVHFLGLLIGLIGCSIVMLGSAPAQPLPPSNNMLGGVTAIGAAICWAAYTVFGKTTVRRYGGPAVSAWTMIAGGAALAAVALLRGAVRPLTGTELLAITYMALAPTAISMGLWYKALEVVDSAVLGPSQYVAPLVSVLLGWVMLGEPLGVSFAVGGILTAIGVHLATRPAHGGEESPQCAGDSTQSDG